MIANNFLSFVEASPSPFHAVAQAKKLLLNAGYQEIKERSNWDLKLQRNGKYFFTRNQSAIIAFAVGGQYVRGNGFSIIGAHTDSPCLKVKPISKKEKSDILQVGVQLYGGGLWHTWFDRDLSVAGRVMVKDETKPGAFRQELVKINQPILRIPTLAIHLDRTVKEGFKFNEEVQLTPILASAVQKALVKEEDGGKTDALSKHHPMFLNLIAKELKVKVEQIADFELCLYDTQPPAIGGAANEYIFSPRLDNLGMSFVSLTALINSTKLESDSNIRMVSLFDNEEVGSVSTAGADSNLLLVTLKRLAETPINDGLSNVSKSVAEEAMLKSMLISADMAHAIHPNYPEKHEENHRPHINKGVVIKHNANQRYATTGVTTLILKELGKKKAVPLQEFVVRNDSPCGSTIGPMLSAKLGLKTIDVGNPQWSMHSIRETCGVDDLTYSINLFQTFFEDYGVVEAQIMVD